MADGQQRYLAGGFDGPRHAYELTGWPKRDSAEVARLIRLKRKPVDMYLTDDSRVILVDPSRSRRPFWGFAHRNLYCGRFDQTATAEDVAAGLV